MRKLCVVVLALMVVSCGQETIIQVPTEPEPPQPPTISGGWQSIVASSTVSDSVWTMVLTQEQTAAFGSWVDDVNDFGGSVNTSVTTDNRVIGSMTLRTNFSCTSSLTTCDACIATATIRGIVDAPDSMRWETDGWPSCDGAPVQVRMNWRKQ